MIIPNLVAPTSGVRIPGVHVLCVSCPWLVPILYLANACAHLLCHAENVFLILFSIIYSSSIRETNDISINKLEIQTCTRNMVDKVIKNSYKYYIWIFVLY